jgi:hypothetical protein
MVAVGPEAKKGITLASILTDHRKWGMMDAVGLRRK